MKTKQQVLFASVLLVVLLVAAGILVMRCAKGHGRRCAATGQKEAPALRTVTSPGATNGASLHSLATNLVQKGTNTLVGAKKSGDKSKLAELTPDQKLVEKMNALLDDKNEKAVIELARQIMKSNDAEVRSAVVAALGWIGVKALPELSQMLGDKDETVSRAALEQWQNAVDEVQDEDMRAKMLVAGMLALTDPEELESTVMDFNELPEAVAIPCLIQLIESQNAAAAEVAREQYLFLTGGPYTNAADANKWLQENAAQ